MTTDDRTVTKVLIDDIVEAEKQAAEIRASSARLLYDERVKRLLSPGMIARAQRNFDVFADQCDLAARRMRELAGALGIKPPDPAN